MQNKNTQINLLIPTHVHTQASIISHPASY